MMLSNAIDNHASGEWVIRLGQVLRQCGAAFNFRMSHVKLQVSHYSRNSRLDLLHTLHRITTAQLPC